MADADIEKAATAVAANGYAFAGQSCISIQRVYVEDAAYDGFVAALQPKVEALVTGDPLDSATQVGPVIDEENRDRILAWVKEAVDGGATLLAGGETDAHGLIRPTLLGDVDLDMQVACDEVFGPVVTLARVKDVDEAIEKANGTDYGLQAGIFTQDITRAMRAAQALDFGGVTVNEAPTWRADHMPYGGVKESGNTREGPKLRGARDDRAAAGGDRLLSVVDDGMRAYYDARARRSTTTGGWAAGSTPSSTGRAGTRRSGACARSSAALRRAACSTWPAAPAF